MRNILPLAKNSFCNLDTIDPVDITDELPKNQKMSSDKQRGISVFAFFYSIFGWEVIILVLFKLALFLLES